MYKLYLIKQMFIMATLGFFAGIVGSGFFCVQAIASHLGHPGIFQTSQARAGSIVSHLKFELTQLLVPDCLLPTWSSRKRWRRSRASTDQQFWQSLGRDRYFSWTLLPFLINVLCSCGDTLHLTPWFFLWHTFGSLHLTVFVLEIDSAKVKSQAMSFFQSSFPLDSPNH